MSRENVDVVRRIYDAAASRDAARVFDLYDPEVELDNTRLLEGAGGGIYHGHDGLRTFFREWHEAWDGVEYDDEELIDAGGDEVVSVVTRRGRGKSSHAQVESRLGLLWTVQAERVVRVEWFPSPDEAHEAAGLDT